MGSPTETEVKTQWQNRVKILNELRKFAATHTAAGSAINVSNNYLAMEDIDIQAQEGDFIDGAMNALFQFRGSLNGALSQSGNMLGSVIRQYGRLQNFPETDVDAILRRLYIYYADNTRRVTSRQFTFGTPTAGGANAGTGVINRLNKDERNFDIEAQTADAKTAKCTADQTSGAVKHEEVFEFIGQTPSRDILAITGSGSTSTIRALSARDSRISNPSFDLKDGGTDAVPSGITDWTVTTSIANFALSSTYYRGFFGSSNDRALQIKVNDKVTQAFTVRNLQVDPNVPLYAQVAFNRNGTGCDGALTFTVGNVSAAIADLTTQSASAWVVLRIALGQNNWYRQINKQSPTISVELSGRAAGSLLVDDLIIAPMSQFDGAWYAVVGGATPFLKEDVFTWTDTEIGAIVQYFLWLAYGRYLPHATGGTITFADPS